MEPEGSRTGLAIYSAWPLMPHRSLTPLGNYLRRMKAKLGQTLQQHTQQYWIGAAFHPHLRMLQLDVNRARRGAEQATRFSPWNCWRSATLPGYSHRQQFGLAPPSQSPRPIQPAPVEDQIGVDPVRPCDPRHRCSLGQCLADNPLLLFQRSILSRRCKRLRVPAPRRAQRIVTVFGTRNIGNRGGCGARRSCYRHCRERLSGSALDWTSGRTVGPIKQTAGSSRGSCHIRQSGAFV